MNKLSLRSKNMVLCFNNYSYYHKIHTKGTIIWGPKLLSQNTRFMIPCDFLWKFFTFSITSLDIIPIFLYLYLMFWIYKIIMSLYTLTSRLWTRLLWQKLFWGMFIQMQNKHMSTHRWMVFLCRRFYSL